MSRTPLSYEVGDISALARSLKAQLASCEQSPGHVELLNMLAKGAGWRNFQHFRAQAEARASLENPQPPAPTDYQRVRRATRHFAANGTLIRWPSKHSERQLCLWMLWAALPARQPLTEKQVNQLLNARHGFGDHALLRRELVDGGWLDRTRDGALYRRIERRPPPDALALIHHTTPKH